MSSRTVGIAMVEDDNSNIINDPGFDDPTEWDGNAVVQDSVVKFNGSATYIRPKNAKVNADIMYQLSFDIVEYASGTVFVSFESEETTPVSGVGTHVTRLTHYSTDNQEFTMVTEDGFVGHIDNFTVTPVTGTMMLCLDGVWSPEGDYNLELGTGILALGADYNELKRHNESGITEQKEKIDAGILAEIGAQIDGEQLQIDGEDLVISGG